ncbi:MAG: EpsG family protein [Clostridia bacterium]|nr:EpsG family protein [Clostridia bacterium]
MTVYYWFYSIVTSLAVLIYVRKKDVDKQRKKVCIVSFFMLFLLFALRHPYMGVDLGWGYSVGYLKSFEKIGQISFLEIFRMKNYLNYEKGYIIFNKIISLISKNQQFFIGSCAFVSLLPIAIYTYKRSMMPLLSLFVFMGLPVFLIFFSGLRQSIAIGITVASMFFVEKKKPIPFILTVILAATFHKSALIFLIAYPLYHTRFSNICKILLLSFVPVVFVFRDLLFNLLSKLFRENAQIGSTGAFLLFLVFVLIYVFLIIFNDYCDKNNIDNERQNGLTNLCYLACIVQIFGGIYDIAMRVGYYFMIYMIIAIPNTIENFRHIRVKYNSYYTIVRIVIMVLFVGYGLYAIYDDSWARTNPYIFFWQFDLFK